MLEDARAEHGVDAVAGVEHEVLARPGHRRAEHEEEDEREPDHGERALGVVHDHLVDDHLGEERRREPDQLDHERGDEHVAPDRAVADELGHEPAEAEALALARRRRRRRRPRVTARVTSEGLRLEEARPFRDRERPRRVAAGVEVEQAAGFDRDEDRRRLAAVRVACGRARECETGKGEPVGARGVDGDRMEAQAQALAGAEQRVARVRRRELLREQRRIDRHVMQARQALQRPKEIRGGERHRALPLQVSCRFVGTLPSRDE